MRQSGKNIKRQYRLSGNFRKLGTLGALWALVVCSSSCATRSSNKGAFQSAADAPLNKSAQDWAGLMLPSQNEQPFPVVLLGRAVVTQKFVESDIGRLQHDSFSTDGPNFLNEKAAEDLHAQLLDAATTVQVDDNPSDDVFRFVGCQTSAVAQLNPFVNNTLTRFKELLSPSYKRFFEVQKPANQKDGSHQYCGQNILSRSGMVGYEFYLDRDQNENLEQVVLIKGGVLGETAVFRRKVRFASANGQSTYQKTDLEKEMVMLIARPITWEMPKKEGKNGKAVKNQVDESRVLLFPANTRFSEISDEKYLKWQQTEVRVELAKKGLESSTSESSKGADVLRYANKSLYALGMNYRVVQKMGEKIGTIGKTNTTTEKAVSKTEQENAFKQWQTPDSLIEISRRFALNEHMRKGGMFGLKTAYASIIPLTALNLMLIPAMVHAAILPGQMAAVGLKAVSGAGLLGKATLDVTGVARHAKLSPEGKYKSAVGWMDATFVTLMIGGAITEMALSTQLVADLANRLVAQASGLKFLESNGISSFMKAGGEFSAQAQSALVNFSNARVVELNVAGGKLTNLIANVRAFNLVSPALSGAAVNTVQAVSTFGQTAFGQATTALQNIKLVETIKTSGYDHNYNGWQGCPDFAVFGFAIGGRWNACLDYVKKAQQIRNKNSEGAGIAAQEFRENVLDKLNKQVVEKQLSQCSVQLMEKMSASSGSELKVCKPKGRSCMNVCTNSTISMLKRWTPEFYKCLATESSENCIIAHGETSVKGRSTSFKKALGL